jgi:uncharacterized protein (DUF433 family)
VSVETQYKHLEARPDSWRKQLYLKERNMTVWQVVGRMQAHGYSSAEAAEQFDLPLAAVLEAVDYYQRHKDLIDAETAEEGRRLRAAGLWE